MKRFTLALLAAVAVGLLVACSAGEQPKPPPGRCYGNSDCPEGFRCKETYCEDIYFPRKDIKPY